MDDQGFGNAKYEPALPPQARAEARFTGYRKPAILAFMVFMIVVPHWVGLSMMLYVGMAISATLWSFLAMTLDDTAASLFNVKEYLRITLLGATTKLKEYGYPDTDPNPPENLEKNETELNGDSSV